MTDSTNNTEFTTTRAYSPRLDRAFVIAAMSHDGQKRKGTEIPYIMHPFHVVLILDRYGYPEDVVIAGALHDVLEDMDCEKAELRAKFKVAFPALAARLANTPHDAESFKQAIEEFLGAEFGETVLRLVRSVSEKKTEGGEKRPWRIRKEDAIAHLQHAQPDEAALKAADALHNIRSILNDLTAHGIATMSRFNAKPADSAWYYRTIAAIVTERLGSNNALAAELRAATDELCPLLDSARD